ncbi:hypothetical protein PRIPAC_96414 [Pristionchus pacificus]|uniref:G protein-coupled receptor n=1 Tax=Pristionchus pacificus TaxID=54126 RepID=A0A2A6D1T4_PRIPA|nr:hypothetical protein PRIPAC_96414 [Pristionchus pacificus]|eukprot:PDM84243.1 G protein-coupled receptor [Pristionchus pacificus]
MRGPWFCELCIAVHMLLSCHSTIITLHSFCFRLYILRRKDVKTELPVAITTVIISIALYLPTCVSVVVFYSVFEDTPSALLKELKLEPFITTFYSGKDVRFIIPVAFVIISTPIVSSINFVIRRKLLQEILIMDVKHRHEHARIAKALTYQLLLPFGMVLGSVAWLGDISGVWSNEMSQRLPLIFCSVIALVSPLFNLIFLPPYRNFFRRPRTNPSIQQSTTY